MNLQSREIKPRSRQARKNSGSRPVGVVGIVTLFELLALGAVLFLFINYRIALKDETAHLNRQASQTKQAIDRYDREIEHLKLRRENLSRWAYVREKLKQYNLVMSFPNPGQVKQLVIVRDRTTASAAGIPQEPLTISQR